MAGTGRLEERPLTVDDVRAALAPLGIEVRELPADTSTALLAAAALSTAVATIVKSLLFVVDGEPLLVLAAGDRRVAREMLKAERRAREIRLAKPAEVVMISGYVVGGVPPVGHRRPIPTVMDATLLDHGIVYAAAGAANAVFGADPRRLLDITGATLTRATQPIE